MQAAKWIYIDIYYLLENYDVLLCCKLPKIHTKQDEAWPSKTRQEAAAPSQEVGPGFENTVLHRGDFFRLSYVI